MSDADARALLSDVQRLGSRVRADQHLTSVALLMGGLVTLGGALVGLDEFGGRVVYWALALPAGFLALAAWLHVQRLRTGVGARTAVWATAGIGLALSPLMVFPPILFYGLPAVAVALIIAAIIRRRISLALWGVGALLLSPLWWLLILPLINAQFTAVGVGLLGLALWRREGWLAGIAAVFTGLAGLEAFHVLSNGLYHLGVSAEIEPALSGRALVVAVLGLLLVAAGMLAWRRERTR